MPAGEAQSRLPRQSLAIAGEDPQGAAVGILSPRRTGRERAFESLVNRWSQNDPYAAARGLGHCRKASRGMRRLLLIPACGFERSAAAAQWRKRSLTIACATARSNQSRRLAEIRRHSGPRLDREFFSARTSSAAARTAKMKKSARCSDGALLPLKREQSRNARDRRRLQRNHRRRAAESAASSPPPQWAFTPWPFAALEKTGQRALGPEAERIGSGRMKKTRVKLGRRGNFCGDVRIRNELKQSSRSFLLRRFLQQLRCGSVRLSVAEESSCASLSATKFLRAPLQDSGAEQHLEVLFRMCHASGEF